MGLFSVLPCVILLVPFIQTVSCGRDDEQSNLLDKYNGNNGGDSGSDDESDGGNHGNHGNDGSCEISCFCNDDSQSICLSTSSQQTYHQHPDAAKHQGLSPGVGVAVVAGASGAAVAAAAAHQKNRPQQHSNNQPQHAQQPRQEPQDGNSKCNWCMRPNCNPGACKAVSNFNAHEDAKKLHDAMQGLGTDEKVLFDILTHRSEEQLEMIRQEYQGLGGGLDNDVKGDTSRKVEKLLKALLQSRADFFADELADAFDDKDSGTMIMILTSMSPCAIKQIGSAYQKKNKNEPLEDGAEDATVFKFEDFLVELIQGNRDEDGQVNVQDAVNDAKALQAAGPDAWFKNKDTFIDIFTHRSFSHLRQVNVEYNKLCGGSTSNEPTKLNDSPLMRDIRKHSGGGKLTQGLLAMMENILDQPGYFANEIDSAVNKKLNPIGIRDNDKLVRIMRGRCGIDLGDIREAYNRKHPDTHLDEKLKNKSFGDYENLLISMIT